jgi:hypothetical protein
MTTLQRLALSLCLLAPLALEGCRSFDLTAPPNFIELEDQDARGFALRAVNADGVVLAVRQVDNDRQGTMTFWTDAVKNRLRTSRGYALLEEKDVKVASGETAHQLRLGRDEGSAGYDYWVTVLVTPPGVVGAGHVLVVEAGGKRDEFGKVKDQLERSIEGLEVR